MRKKLMSMAVLGAAFVLGFAVHGLVPAEPVAFAQGQRIFELRTYTAPAGKLDDLHARFRDHTLELFEKHGIENVAYFAPQDAPLADNTLIYLIAHPSREAAKMNFSAFGKDPEWQRVAEESQRDGRIVERIESVFLDATDYSPLK